MANIQDFVTTSLGTPAQPLDNGNTESASHMAEALKKLLICLDFSTQPSLEFTGNDQKARKISSEQQLSG